VSVGVSEGDSVRLICGVRREMDGVGLITVGTAAGVSVGVSEGESVRPICGVGREMEDGGFSTLGG
jgi:hypothetical protein